MSGNTPTQAGDLKQRVSELLRQFEAVAGSNVCIANCDRLAAVLVEFMADLGIEVECSQCGHPRHYAHGCGGTNVSWCTGESLETMCGCSRGELE